MALQSDIDVVLTALSKERIDLHERLMQIDRIVKRIKKGESYTDSTPKEIESEPKQQPAIKTDKKLPKDMDTKLHVLLVMDELKKASKLKIIQSKYFQLTGNSYNIRESVRSLNRTGLMKMMRNRSSDRGILWVKTEWLKDGQLLEEFKPMGFDVIYHQENIEFL